MNSRKSLTTEAGLAVTAPVYECCTCQPLQPSLVSSSNNEEYPYVLITEELRERLRLHLQPYIARSIPFSILLLHLSQLEHMHITSQVVLPQKRRHHHAPEGVLEQVLANVRRAIRESDTMLVHRDVGAAILFLYVDQQGMASLFERIYNSITLLQAETIIPPLNRETSILLGTGSTSTAKDSLDDIFAQASKVAREFRLRPAITVQTWHDSPSYKPTVEPQEASMQEDEHKGSVSSKRPYPTIPFMILPTTIPSRLKPLLPHSIASQLRCAPVGRNHHCITVAMANPTNTATIEQLQELTGMTIFPVVCEDDALDRLLDKGW